MAVNSAFANGFGGTPMVGLLGAWSPDPAQSLPQGLLPNSPQQPTVGVLGLPGDPNIPIPPPFDPYQLAGAAPQSGGDLALMASQLSALRAINDHLDIAAGWLGQTPEQRDLTNDAGANPTPHVQPPPRPITASPDQSATVAALGIGAGATPDRNSAPRLTIDPSYTVQAGDNLSSIARRYVASGLYPDANSGVGALARGNRLTTSTILAGQPLVVPSSAAPEDARLGAAMIARDARFDAARTLDRRAAATGDRNPFLIPGIPVGRANETWSTWNNADSIYGPGPTSDWSAKTGIYSGAKAKPDWLVATRHLLAEMFAPEVNAYEYGIVRPFWSSLSALANTPLGDPGTYETIQSAGPPGAIIGGGLGLAAKGLDRLAELGADAEAAETEAQAIQLIGGRPPINSKLAGQVHPLNNRPDIKALYPDSVRFTDAGYPDFWPYHEARFKSDQLTGDLDIDRGSANEASGYDRTPKGYVWHHVEDKKTMLLVPRDLHEAIGHTGGRAGIKFDRSKP